MPAVRLLSRFAPLTPEETGRLTPAVVDDVGGDGAVPIPPTDAVGPDLA